MTDENNNNNAIYLAEAEVDNSFHNTLQRIRNEAAAAVQFQSAVLLSALTTEMNMNSVPLVNIGGDHAHHAHHAAAHPHPYPTNAVNSGATATAYGVLVPGGVMPTYVSLGPHAFVQPTTATTAASTGHRHHSYETPYEQHPQPPVPHRAEESWYNPYILPSSMGGDRYTHPHHAHVPPPQHHLPPAPHYVSSRLAHHYPTYPFAAGPPARDIGMAAATQFAPSAAWPHAMPPGAFLAPSPFGYQAASSRMLHSPHIRRPPHASADTIGRRRRMTNATSEPRTGSSGVPSRETAAAPRTAEAHIFTAINTSNERKNVKRALSECSPSDAIKQLDQIGSEEDGQCCICLDEPSAQDLASINGCAHKFCFSCIEKWSERENTCPLCKTRFTKIDRVNKPPPYKKRRRGEQRTKLTKKVRNRDQREELFMPNVSLRMPNASVDPVDRRRPFVLFSNLPQHLLSLHNALGLANPNGVSASSALHHLAAQQQQHQQHHHPSQPPIPFAFAEQGDFYWRM